MNCSNYQRHLLKQLFDEFGIGYKQQIPYQFVADPNTVTCTEGDTKVEGYCGFFTLFQFDDDGKFVKMEIGL